MSSASTATDPQSRFDAEELELQFRRKTDRRVMFRLAAAGYDSTAPEWQRVQDALVEYGFGVMRTWLRNGAARAKAHEYHILGAGAIPAKGHLVRDEADSIAGELIVDAIDPFRCRLAAGTWDPDGGASLATFFIRFLLFRLPNVARRHDRQRRAIDKHETLDNETAVDVQTADPTLGPEALLLNDEALAEAIALLGSPQVFAYILMLEDGMTYKEIASTDGRTESAIKSEVMRARRKARELRVLQDEER